MKTDYLATMQKDPKLYGKRLTWRSKLAAFVALSLPIIIAWATVWRLMDAMICGVALSLLYYGLSLLHFWKVDPSLWHHVIRKDLGGNRKSKLNYYFWFCLFVSLLLSALTVPYFAYISWGPGVLRLPMPYVNANIDLVYYFWLIILYLIVVPIGEVMYFFIMIQLTLSLKFGRLIIPIAYGMLNLMWIMPCVGGDIWRAVLTLVFIALGFLFYWLHWRRDILRTLGLRICLSGTLIFILIWLSLLKQHESPNFYFKGSEENFFYQAKVNPVPSN